MLKSLDHIFVLSLKTSSERQMTFKKNFPELVDLNIFEWFLVDKDTENTERGCYISHRKILELAKKRKYKEILIIEDDIKLLVSWDSFVNYFNNIRKPKNWKAIQLGYIPIRTTKTSDPNLYAINCNYFTEAYLVNVSQIEIPEYNGSQIDCLLFCNGHSHLDLIVNPSLSSKITNDMYAHNPRLFQQIFEDSDIGHDNGIIIFFYNFYGSMCNITELSSYINLLLLSFLIVFALISLILILLLPQIRNILIAVFISIVSSTVILCYLNGNDIIKLEYE